MYLDTSEDAGNYLKPLADKNGAGAIVYQSELDNSFIATEAIETIRIEFARLLIGKPSADAVLFISGDTDDQADVSNQTTIVLEPQFQEKSGKKRSSKTQKL